jgi:hypothetical protein
MRFKVAQELNFKEIPCKIIPSGYTIDQLKAIVIKDNVSYGSEDWEALANEWDYEQLQFWGLDIPITLNDETELKDLSNKIDNLYRIEIICKDEEHQENIYNKLIEQGYECRLLTL